MGFCPYFVKNLAQCPCFETIKHRVPILKLDLKKNRVTGGTQHFYAYLSLNFLKKKLSET